MRAWLLVVLLALLPACSEQSVPHPAAVAAPCPPATVPDSGAFFGVSIDWQHDSLVGFQQRFGHAPAVAVTFAGVPLGLGEESQLMAQAGQAAAAGSSLLLTLEPRRGLAAVTPDAVRRVTDMLRAMEGMGVPVIVRFAHEMNGSWYPWGQRPAAYRAAFRHFADAVHARTGAAMMWAPSYGGGYPFGGGRYAGRPDVVDTNRNGRSDSADNSYRPYYPGDQYVDWVGMSLYHWGSVYPWGENELPVAGKLVRQLTGDFYQRGTDERSVPDFYQEYGVRHGKPVAITETAALFAPGRGGASGREIKTRWWHQVMATDLVERFPQIKMVNWFEWDKLEPETHGEIDWRFTDDPQLLLTLAVPPWARFGGERSTCSA